MSEKTADELRLQRKLQVALGYRILAAQRWGDLGDDHISARDPEREDCFPPRTPQGVDITRLLGRRAETELFAEDL